jgi:16S rRNA (cytidine1402-2'-O)-methyltransferase
MDRPEARKSEGLLTIVSTPIGNLGDITVRALDVLKTADAVLAEDTRRSRRLLDHYGIRAKLIAYHDHNKERVTPGIVERLKSGENLALVSDAGTPGVSDPGFYLVRAAAAADIPMTAAPGANAILPALVLSGFATDAFVFEGFLPKKKGDLARAVERLAVEPRTIVLFVSPHQLTKVLATFRDRLPERRLAVARELTKIHEEIVRGTAAELLARFEGRTVRGEIVLLVAGTGRRHARRAGLTDPTTE